MQEGTGARTMDGTRPRKGTVGQATADRSVHENPGSAGAEAQRAGRGFAQPTNTLAYTASGADPSLRRTGDSGAAS